jgi:diguanylate cyclase (GGDEF)-like protein
MKRFIQDKWLYIFLIFMISMLLYLQYVVAETTDRLKKEEKEKSLAYAGHITKIIIQKTNGKIYEKLHSDPKLRVYLEDLLEAFLIPKYEYMFLVRREQKRRYRFLLDGSKKEKEDFGTLFLPMSDIYDSVYDSKEVRIVKQQDELKGIWVSILYPIVIKGKTEALLILDLSEWYGKYLSDFNSPIMKVVHYVQIVLIIVMVILALISWRIRRMRQALYIDNISGAHTKMWMYEFFKSKRLDAYNVILIDIDNFKAINQFYGWNTGDTLLSRIVMHIKEAVPEKTLLIRAAGTEFFLFIDKEEGLEAFVRNLHGTFKNRTFVVDQHHIRISTTIVGIKIPENTASLQNIQHIAYEELLNVKNTHKNHYSVLDPGSEKAIQYRQIDYISKLISKENITLLYQPILETKTLKTKKYEVLVRLNDEMNGEHISPGYFMNLISGTSLYIRLSKLIFKEVFNNLRQNPKLCLSVNLDLDDLYNEDIISMLVEFLENNPTEAQRLTLEILEKSNIKDYKKVNEIFERLKTYNVNIAIDDFGSGYANFHHLLYLKADMMKIDGSLISALAHNENQRIRPLLSMLLTLANVFGYKTVAEFVEDEAIYLACKELGFDYVQGYYFAKPGPLPPLED